jgi:hypothetical protein
MNTRTKREAISLSRKMVPTIPGTLLLIAIAFFTIAVGHNQLSAMKIVDETETAFFVSGFRAAENTCRGILKIDGPLGIQPFATFATCASYRMRGGDKGRSVAIRTIIMVFPSQEAAEEDLRNHRSRHAIGGLVRTSATIPIAAVATTPLMKRLWCGSS